MLQSWNGLEDQVKLQISLTFCLLGRKSKLKTAENPQEALAETGLAVSLQHIVHSNDAQRQPTWKNHLKLTLPATESQKLTTRLCKATFAYTRNGFEKNNFCGRENV